MCLTLVRFLPGGLVSIIRNGPGEAIDAFERTIETLELVWTLAMTTFLPAQTETTWTTEGLCNWIGCTRAIWSIRNERRATSYFIYIFKLIDEAEQLWKFFWVDKLFSLHFFNLCHALMVIDVQWTDFYLENYLAQAAQPKMNRTTSFSWPMRPLLCP